MNDSYKGLIELILSNSIEDYFELIRVYKSNDTIDIYLKELNKTTEEFSTNKLNPKGFLRSNYLGLSY